MDDNNKRTSDHLANERTLLAWIRTGIGIMAFGFVVVKFSLFVKQLTAILGKDAVPAQKGYSAILGVLLVGVGLLMTVFAFLRFKKTQRQINENAYQSASLLLAVVVGFIVVVGLLLIGYLLQNI